MSYTFYGLAIALFKLSIWVGWSKLVPFSIKNLDDFTVLEYFEMYFSGIV